MTGEPEGTEREEPVGTPVVRGDPEIAGAHAEEAVEFDPDDPASLARAAEAIRAFVEDEEPEDSLYVLRLAAACAALVRGEGSYKSAAERAGDPVTVDFLRKWARVHDLPISIRRQIATGEIPPSAAKHIARVTGDARFLLAWAVLDGDLSVDQVRTIASDVGGGVPIERALSEHGVTPGRLSVTLSLDHYRELRRRASLEGRDPGAVIADALDERIGDDR